jgi:uncharacterized protein (DUF885 family)
MSLRKLFAGASALALLAACTPSPENSASEPTAPIVETADTEQTETARLNAWFQEEFELELALSPESQTYLGMVDDLDAYGRWDDPSEAAVRAGLDREAARIRYMNENFDFEALTDGAKVSWRFAEFIAENNAQQAEFYDHNYIFTQFFGPHTNMPSLLIGVHGVSDIDQANAYISRLNGMGDVLRSQTAQADARARAGVVAPAFAFPVIIENSRGMITGAPFDDSGVDSPLLADFTGKIDALLTAEENPISDAQHSDLLERATTALLTQVGPAYTGLIEVMEQHAALADGNTDGVWTLPEGAAFYESQLVNYTTRTDMTAAGIHQTGLDEVARIHDEMRAIMTQVGFDGTLAEFFEHLRTSEEFYYPNTDEGRQRYLSEATDMIDHVMTIAPDYFGTLPTGAMEVRAVEEYRITTATGAFYEQGSLDGSRPGRYYVNLADMAEMPVYQMETLAYHEGAPGHHFQVALTQELEGTPMFQRFTWYSAYGEGWALYAESLGKDMGLFTDPYQDFGRLSYEVFRAARLVVDTGIHAMHWSEEEAIAYMTANTPMTPGDIESEIRRYIVWPGQAVSYKIGMLTILDLRNRSMAALGDDFDYGEFHDIVLTNGSVPLNLMEELVMDWVAEKQAAE